MFDYDKSALKLNDIMVLTPYIKNSNRYYHYLWQLTEIRVWKAVFKMTDMVHWDDLNEMEITQLLGEFTEYEVESNSDSDSDSWSGDSPKRRKTDENQPPKQSVTTKIQYQCPLCVKKYKTTSGFRYHISKVHKRADLKAKAHREDETNHRDQKKETASNPTTSASTSAIINNDSVKACMKECIQSAINAVSMDKILGSDPSTDGHVICDVAKSIVCSDTTMTGLEVLVTPHFLEIFGSFGKTSSFVADREHMWAAFLKVTNDDNFCSALQQCIQNTTDISDRVANLFTQCFLDELVDSLCEHFISKIELASHSSEELTKEDNENLFYICGFLIHAITKREKRCSKSSRITLALNKLCLTSQDASPGFMDKYRVWTLKVNRGGLKICGDNFFFMIRQMENICRKQSSVKTLTAKSLNRIALKENILENTTISYYWDKLMVSSEGIKLSLLESICDLFLRLRGRAVTKYVQRQMEKEKAKSQSTSAVVKKSKSLRQRLKNKQM